MAGLVVGGEAPFLLGDDAALLLRTHGHLQNGVVDILLADKAVVPPHGQERGLVQEVFQVRAGEARRALGDLGEVHVVAQAFAPGMDLQDLLAALDVGQTHVHPTVEAAGTQQCVVKDVGPVGGRHDDDALVVVEAVHFHKQLV